MAAYKAVIFDLFGTLTDNFTRSLVNCMILETADILGAPYEPFRKIWYDTLMDRAVGTYPTGEDNMAHVCEQLGVKAERKQLEEAMAVRMDYFRRALKPRPDAISTVTRLQEAGLKTGLVSDCSWEAPALWPDSELHGLFETAIFSCDVGVKKPDPRIYRMACEGMGVEPGDCIYVGDGSSRELTGAEGVGMTPILIRVPYLDPEEDYWIEKDDWEGTTITSLSEVLDHALP